MISTTCEKCGQKTWTVPGNDNKAEAELRRRKRKNPCTCGKVNDQEFWTLWNNALAMITETEMVNN